jgi:SAM-dependent methyltransferase
MIVLSILAILTVCFAGVLLFGAPYLPTLKPQIAVALDLAELQPGDTMLELGCGDGKVLIAAAKQGIHTVGYELNPLLFFICKLRCLPYRRYVTVHYGNFWRRSWPPADAIFVFLLPKYMDKLDKKVMQYKHLPVNLVSFAFAIEDRVSEASKDGIYLYRYDENQLSARKD